ncbi:nucleotidyltransferase family protein [Nocardioides pantholopis]|uniref:nucleotidyltransferase family protein n=1 Tax=Nocardioides pantholopis TaxID=2483798 RepID=UPI000F07BEA6|nr:nucleotidyltransferase family protein [Nocardioides pantholopis]
MTVAVHGLLLAAGAGTRMGMPKALVEDQDGSWLRRSLQVLADGGCSGVTVVLGAALEEALPLLDGVAGAAGTTVQVVVAHEWAQGMSESLRAGLEALAPTAVPAALVTLVDLPDVTPEVVRRVAAAADGPAALARATYDGRPGHPVLLGRDHWAAICASVDGDSGARDYLAEHDARAVECGDLATGRDVDSR